MSWVKDHAGGERWLGAGLFGEVLGIGIAAGAGSFAVDRCWIRYQAKGLGGGRLGLRGRGAGRGGGGWGGFGRSGVDLAGIL